MDDVGEVELIDLTGIELREAVAHMLEQNPELFLVVGANDRSCLSTPRLLTLGFALILTSHDSGTYLRGR